MTRVWPGPACPLLTVKLTDPPARWSTLLLDGPAFRDTIDRLADCLNSLSDASMNVVPIIGSLALVVICAAVVAWLLLQLVNSLPFLYMGWGGRELAMAVTVGAAGNLTYQDASGLDERQRPGGQQIGQGDAFD